MGESFLVFYYPCQSPTPVEQHLCRQAWKNSKLCFRARGAQANGESLGRGQTIVIVS